MQELNMKKFVGKIGMISFERENQGSEGLSLIFIKMSSINRGALSK